MKISLAQINPTVGDVSGNLEKIKDAIRRAPKNSLVVFPEMVVTGYPLEDLVFSHDLQQESLHALYEIGVLLRDEAPDRQALVGYLEPGEEGEKPRNAAALISNVGVEQKSSKIALPTYGVFDERRLFTPGEKIMTGLWRGEFSDTKYAVLICEDIWRLEGEAIAQAKEADVDVLISINGSPFEDGKHETRVEVMRAALERTGAKYGVYLNMVGGQDDLVFDGGSFIYDAKRKGRLGQLPFFREELQQVDVSTLHGFSPVGEYTISREEMLYQAAVLGLQDYVEKNGFKGLLVGVSGGIDSALVAAMAADAVGGTRLLGISMPSVYSSEGSLTDAEDLMLRLKGNYRVHSIAGMVKSFQDKLMLQGVAAENLQARCRGVILMGVSNEEGYLVLAPGNKSELSMGYSTLYGDTVGGYAPLKDLFKTDVYKLAEWRNSVSEVIPPASIEKPPSAELAPGQVDQDSLPPYDLLDAFLHDAIELRHGRETLANTYGEELATELLRKIKTAEWKRRQYPIGPKLSTLSFGRERFMPITNKTGPAMKRGK